MFCNSSCHFLSHGPESGPIADRKTSAQPVPPTSTLRPRAAAIGEAHDQATPHPCRAAGCCIGGPALGQQTAKARELRIGYQRSGTLLVAKHQRVLEKRLDALGVDVKWVEFSFGPPLLEALNVGSIDYGTTGDTPPIFAQAGKAKLLYVAAAAAAGSGSAILVPPGSSLQTLADLRGKASASPAPPPPII